MDIIAVWLIDIVFFLFFLFCWTVVWNVGQSYAFFKSIFVYTLLSKLKWHGRAECLSCQPCMQLCGDKSSFVLELVGARRASKNSDECGIEVGALLLTWVLFASVSRLPNAPSYSESFKPHPFPGNNIYDTFPTGIWPDTTKFTTLTKNLLVSFLLLHFSCNLVITNTTTHVILFPCLHIKPLTKTQYTVSFSSYLCFYPHISITKSWSVLSVPVLMSLLKTF
jgi:hypothetical protein